MPAPHHPHSSWYSPIAVCEDASHYPVDLGRLRPPDERYRLDQLLVAERRGRATLHAFETREQARSEDLLRARLLRKFAGELGAYSPQALRLSERLIGAAHGGYVESSLASSLFCREVRMLRCGQLLEGAERFPAPVRAFTVIPPLMLSYEELLVIRGAPLLERLRAMVNRAIAAGERTGKGFLTAYIHGEYDPVAELFNLHFHGLTAGDHLAAIARLQHQLHSQDAANVALRRSAAVRPVQISRTAPSVRQIAYRFQSYWPAVVRDGGGKSRRRRIPGKAHSAMLLWLDDQRLADLELAMGQLPGFQRLRKGCR